MSEYENEYIPKEPSIKEDRMKDPKRVEAGKRLAAYNKMMKEKLVENDTIQQQDDVKEPTSLKVGWPSEGYLNTALGIIGVGVGIGIGLTVINLYFKQEKPDNVRVKPPVIIEPQPELIRQPVRRLIGME